VLSPDFAGYAPEAVKSADVVELMIEATASHDVVPPTPSLCAWTNCSVRATPSTKMPHDPFRSAHRGLGAESLRRHSRSACAGA